MGDDDDGHPWVGSREPPVTGPAPVQPPQLGAQLRRDGPPASQRCGHVGERAGEASTPGRPLRTAAARTRTTSVDGKRMTAVRARLRQMPARRRPGASRLGEGWWCTVTAST